MTREEILKEALKRVNGEREQQYGSPEDSFMAIAELWTVYLEHGCVEDNGAVLLHPEDVAAMMALLKIARISSGVDKVDNWVDLAGYAACGGAIQTARGDGQARVKTLTNWLAACPAVKAGAVKKSALRAAKIEAVESYCDMRDCDKCPRPCQEKPVDEMTVHELDRMLEWLEGDTDEQS